MLDDNEAGKTDKTGTTVNHFTSGSSHYGLASATANVNALLIFVTRHKWPIHATAGNRPDPVHIGRQSLAVNICCRLRRRNHRFCFAWRWWL